jgi:oligopeptide transport system substrate-binding protein
MTRISKFRVLAIAAQASVLLVACGPGGGGGTPSETLDANQSLSFPMVNDIGSLDPADMSAAVDIDIARNLYSGLYKFKDDLTQVPDIATGPPQISSDGLTYTFTMRKDAKFSNGDPIKSDDFIYSWNRAAAKQSDYASVFEPVKGYEDLTGKTPKSKTLSGLTKVDDFTFKAQLSKPAGYWYTEVALWTAWVVNKKVITAGGEDTWWTKPDTMVGSGPFKMTARTPKQSVDFAPVSGWWGGSTGNLTKIHIEIIEDQKSQVTKYESGGFDIIGYANGSPTPEDILRYKNDAKLSKQLTLQPAARTSWIGFNFKTGPFAGDAGKDGRKAFSMSVDKKQLIDVACAKGATCVEATGGVITKGLKGYLGDNQDPNEKFDAAAAKKLYDAWDPQKTKVKNLVYYFNTGAQNKAIAENLQAQWKQNLGIDIGVQALDRATFFKNRSACQYALFRHSWGADYDHPQDWFDFLFVTGGGSSGSCYSNPSLDKQVADANKKPLDQALPDYKAAQQTMINDAVYGDLFYGVQPYLIKPYVRGAGGNPLYDFYWNEIKMVKH